MVLHSFVVSSPEPIYAILPTSVYTVRPTHLYHTPYSFIPHVLLLYTIRPTHLYLTPHPLYTKKIINKAAKAR